MKIAVNKCYGGFRLSAIAQKVIAARKGKEIVFRDSYKGKEVSLEEAMKMGSFGIYSDLEDLPRDDADLIAVIESMGDEANTRVSHLCVVEIPDGVEWEIEEYDGMEWVSEKHRTW